MFTGLRKPKATDWEPTSRGRWSRSAETSSSFDRVTRYSAPRDGAFAEYVCVRNAVAPKPANLTFEQALPCLSDHGIARLDSNEGPPVADEFLQLVGRVEVAKRFEARP